MKVTDHGLRTVGDITANVWDVDFRDEKDPRGDLTVFLTREVIALIGADDQDVRWHLAIHKRGAKGVVPLKYAVRIAHRLRPGVNFTIPAPALEEGQLMYDGSQLHLWESHDDNLAAIYRVRTDVEWDDPAVPR